MSYLYRGQKSPVVFMFPGQGSQFYQMGRELYQNNPVFQRWMNELDRLIRSELGQSVLAAIYHDNNPRSKTFDDIRLSHPAIFMIEYSLGKTLIEQEIKPDYLLGASLGELAAATLAGVLSLPDAVRFVVRQGLLFDRRLAGPASAPEGGTMLAILADQSLYQQTPLLRNRCEIAAYNAESLIVIAGKTADIADIERHLSSRDIVYQRLPVRLAFHSSHIDVLKPEFELLASQLITRPAEIPVISCHNTETLQRFGEDHFWQTLRQPIRFAQTLARIEREAAERGESLIYLDLGPSGTLANLIRQNLRGRKLPRTMPVISAFGRDLEKFDEVLALSRELQPLPADAPAGRPQPQPQQHIHRPPPPAQQIQQPVQQPTQQIRQPAPLPAQQPAQRSQPTQQIRQPAFVQTQAPGPKRLYVFPGQGSQRIGMGAELFEEFPDYVARADKILGYSLKTLCLEDPDQLLSNTQYTQPALYSVSALAYLSKQKRDPRKADFLAGHSLGEYSALFAAGAFSFETGLKLVKKRGELMARASGGGMAAVVGRAPEEITTLLRQHGLDALDIVNYNSPTQLVLAGPTDSINQARETFQRLEITFIPLNVSAPFHSRYMKSVMEEFGQYLKQFSYSPLQTPVIANIHAAPYKDDELIDNLTCQICSSVRWLDSIDYLIRQGDFEFEELGPGKVLTKLVNTIRNTRGVKG